MALFLSTFCNKLDAKGRVSVPASFRVALAHPTFSGVVGFRSLTLPAIECFDMERMEKLSGQLDYLEPFSQAHDDVALALFAEAQQMNFDTEGRILLPKVLCEHAQLKATVAFVGRGPTFQIWDPEIFASHQAEARARLKEQPSPLHTLALKGRGGDA